MVIGNTWNAIMVAQSWYKYKISRKNSKSNNYTQCAQFLETWLPWILSILNSESLIPYIPECKIKTSWILNQSAEIVGYCLCKITLQSIDTSYARTFPFQLLNQITLSCYFYNQISLRMKAQLVHSASPSPFLRSGAVNLCPVWLIYTSSGSRWMGLIPFGNKEARTD